MQSIALRSIKHLSWTAVCCLSICCMAQAALVQHLDGSVAASVQTNGSGGVTSWLDQTGTPVLNAVPLKGTVDYPSAPFPSGVVGLDFGLDRNSLTAIDSTTANSIFNCTTSAGFFSLGGRPGGCTRHDGSIHYG
ncbi:MAG: hypothetical protein HC901_02825, partial [Bdellovibrionaceae bacterium]|nr:hypothetical protein [Pseudobdellovibrionaceae bacterium]